MRWASPLIALALVSVVAGCGGDGNTSDNAPQKDSTPLAGAPPPRGSLEERWRGSKENIAVTAGTSDHAVGPNRISFLIIDRQSRLVERPTATVLIATGLRTKPFARTVATLEAIGVPGGEKADAQNLYVATVAVPKPGRYWFLAQPVGGRDVRALGNLIVKADNSAPSVGDRAVPSRTPTLRSTKGDLERLSTSRRPDRGLYASSVREALTSKDPFVVTFATPLYCQTRTCGPVVDVVSSVRKRLVKSDVRFIHAEVYKDNDPAKGVARWIEEWNLQSEPWTFVVDRRGRISAAFEGAFSPRELLRAVRRV